MTPGPVGERGMLTVRSVDATLVLVPMRRALGTSVTRITEAPLLLIDLRTEEGVTGRAYLFCYFESAGYAALALIRDVNAVLAGIPAPPASMRHALESRFTLLGVRGLVSAVLASVDAACWDALAPWPGCLGRPYGRYRPTTATAWGSSSRRPPPRRRRSWWPRAAAPSRCGSDTPLPTTAWLRSARSAQRSRRTSRSWQSLLVDRPAHRARARPAVASGRCFRRTGRRRGRSRRRGGRPRARSPGCHSPRGGRGVRAAPSRITRVTHGCRICD